MDLYADPAGTALDQAERFVAALGGSAGNIAAGLARLGAEVSLAARPDSLRANGEDLVSAKREVIAQQDRYPQLKIPVAIMVGDQDRVVMADVHGLKLAQMLQTGAGGADIVAFANSQGLFAGASIEGSYLDADNDWNALYYGGGATATKHRIGARLRQAAGPEWVVARIGSDEFAVASAASSCHIVRFSCG